MILVFVVHYEAVQLCTNHAAFFIILITLLFERSASFQVYLIVNKLHKSIATINTSISLKLNHLWKFYSPEPC